MKTTKILSKCALALLIAVWGMTAAFADERNPGQTPENNSEVKAKMKAARAEAEPEGLIFEDLECGDCVDTYFVKCKGPTRWICADVEDDGPFGDTKFSVTVIASKPKPARGQADTEISPQGGLSSVACVMRPTVKPGAMQAFVVIAEANTTGIEDYSTVIRCYDDLFFVTKEKISKVQDQ